MKPQPERYKKVVEAIMFKDLGSDTFNYYKDWGVVGSKGNYYVPNAGFLTIGSYILKDSDGFKVVDESNFHNNYKKL